uniref:Uncharacterized protein n=1 Tax=Vespula pensylvanica TaxID=30213 RepID=A0A834P8I8_VESPE|nr:hypothetical protein H0235_004922 [Vespula pensylvanica]
MDLLDEIWQSNHHDSNEYISHVPAKSMERLVKAVVRGNSAVVVPVLLRSSIARFATDAAASQRLVENDDVPIRRPALHHDAIRGLARERDTRGGLYPRIDTPVQDGGGRTLALCPSSIVSRYLYSGTSCLRCRRRKPTPRVGP